MSSEIHSDDLEYDSLTDEEGRTRKERQHPSTPDSDMRAPSSPMTSNFDFVHEAKRLQQSQSQNKESAATGRKSMTKKTAESGTVVSDVGEEFESFEYDCTAESVHRSRSKERTSQKQSTRAVCYSSTPSRTSRQSTGTSSRLVVTPVRPVYSPVNPQSAANRSGTPASKSARPSTPARSGASNYENRSISHASSSARADSESGVIRRKQLQQKDGNDRLLRKIIEQQTEILDVVRSNEREIKNLKRKLEEEEPKKQLKIPLQIKNAVHDGFSNGEDRDLHWQLENQKFGDQCNDEMTDFIKSYVNGIYPNVESAVLEAAMKTYFTSKKEADNRKRKAQYEAHRKRQVKYERRKEKSKRRVEALNSTNWLPERKEKYMKALIDKDLISSDEEGDEGVLISRPPSWESEKFRKLKTNLDRIYLEDVVTLRSRNMLRKRRRGNPVQKALPKIADDLNWIVCNVNDSGTLEQE